MQSLSVNIINNFETQWNHSMQTLDTTESNCAVSKISQSLCFVSIFIFSRKINATLGDSPSKMSVFLFVENHINPSATAYWQCRNVYIKNHRGLMLSRHGFVPRISSDTWHQASEREFGQCSGCLKHGHSVKFSREVSLLDSLSYWSLLLKAERCPSAHPVTCWALQYF